MPVFQSVHPTQRDNKDRKESVSVRIRVRRLCDMWVITTVSLPVSTCADRMADHTSCAGMTRRALPSASYFSYKASNSGPQTSGKPLASLGQNNDQVPDKGKVRGEGRRGQMRRGAVR